MAKSQRKQNWLDRRDNITLSHVIYNNISQLLTSVNVCGRGQLVLSSQCVRLPYEDATLPCDREQLTRGCDLEKWPNCEKTEKQKTTTKKKKKKKSIHPYAHLWSLWLASGGGTSWRDYISQLAWECLGISQKDLESSAMDRNVWADPLSLLTPWPLPGNAEGKWMNKDNNNIFIE